MSDEKRVSDEMGGLLWRRVYQARARLEMIEPVWPRTLEAVLRQAGIPEPDDDAVFGKGTEVVHGRDLPAAAAVPVGDGEVVVGREDLIAVMRAAQGFEGLAGATLGRLRAALNGEGTE